MPPSPSTSTTPTGNRLLATESGTTTPCWGGHTEVKLDTTTKTVRRLRWQPTDHFTCLVHIGAREYGPTVGKFLSVDPVIRPGNPQQVNAYIGGSNS